MTDRIELSARVAGLAVVAALLLAPVARAHACGGFFCNRPPPNPLDPLPIAQAGENVAFGIEGDPANGNAVVTAHIQILYSGTAAAFSWVIPVASVPELSTGTDRLFSALGAPTQPRFQPSYEIDGTCLPNPPLPAGGFGGASGAGGSTASADAGVPGGVNVVFQGVVGPYAAKIVQSSDANELKDWLTTNGYYLDPRAGQIIDTYVREGKYFVALKLDNGQDVRSIRPIVLTFHGTDPCVPLRLTAIAALPDMPVTIYVLGRTRAVPLGFLELKLDELRIDWPAAGANYAALLREAADDAGGNAFVTEYAGTSTVATTLWTAGQFDPDALRTAPTPPVYVQRLTAQGLGNDSQTLPLLQQYIPMPQEAIAQGIPPATFYNNLSTYWVQYAFPPFDLATLTDKIVETIIEPRRLAQQMIGAHPYLTRLGTFISPEEMNADPLFAFNADLGDRPAVHGAVLRTVCGDREYLSCNAPVRLELPDGRMAWVRRGVSAATCQFPAYDTSLQTLPAAEVAWERGLSGEGTRRLDNQSAIQNGLALHNAAFNVGNTGPGTGGQGVGGRGSVGAGLGGASGAGGTGGHSTPGAGPTGSGCACALTGGSTPGGLLFVAGVLLVAWRARRRRRG
ncbi:MAG TPA: DUF2330 domain-containing protein [Polyangia bacterium]|jgi:MYXO-CTERM domain-containing protein|nr:DUF2330 domain-containing protein [Polyangia bacterium]